MATFLHNAGILSVLKENVSPTVTNIDPTEKPFQANIGEVDIDNPYEFEWLQESLPTPNDGGFPTGFQWTDIAAATTFPEDSDGVTIDAETFQFRTKLKARTMIQARGFELDNWTQESNKHGVEDEIGHQLSLIGEALQIDCEKAILALRAPVAAAAATAPITAGLPAWLKTNTRRAGDGADPTLSGGEPVITSVDGTATGRGLSEAELLGVIGEIYDNGGNPDMIMLGRELKQNWSAYMLSGNARSATQYQDQGRSPNSGIQVVGAVDFYVSDFGVLSVVPNRFQRTRDVFVLDSSLFELGTFRDYYTEELGIEGDSQRFYMGHDFCLVSRDESGSGIVADIDSTEAMTA